MDTTMRPAFVQRIQSIGRSRPLGKPVPAGAMGEAGITELNPLQVKALACLERTRSWLAEREKTAGPKVRAKLREMIANTYNVGASIVGGREVDAELARLFEKSDPAAIPVKPWVVEMCETDTVPDEIPTRAATPAANASLIPADRLRHAMADMPTDRVEALLQAKLATPDTYWPTVGITAEQHSEAVNALQAELGQRKRDVSRGPIPKVPTNRAEQKAWDTWQAEYDRTKAAAKGSNASDSIIRDESVARAVAANEWQQDVDMRSAWVDEAMYVRVRSRELLNGTGRIPANAAAAVPASRSTPGQHPTISPKPVPAPRAAAVTVATARRQPCTIADYRRARAEHSAQIDREWQAMSAREQRLAGGIEAFTAARVCELAIN